MLTLLKDTRPVNFDNARIVFVFFVETHAGQMFKERAIGSALSMNLANWSRMGVLF